MLVFSLAFYAWGEPRYILLMLLTTLVDYIGGRLIAKFKGKKQAKFFMILSAAITLSSLAVFKYAGFFVENVNAVFKSDIANPNILLPIGISFYTFQALTYVVDVYRGNVKVQKSYWKLLLYVSMFPQLIAGPIVRYSDVEKQIEHRTVTLEGASAGIIRFSVGLLKKAIVANLAGELATKLIGGELSGLTTLGAWAGIFAYALQIYFDFSGYSDMAIGLGHLFGFHFPENFNYPYAAVSVNDFWHRWHMTLTSFFRDYVYIPLGGNRKHWAANMLFVWFLTGLWHGAAWNFVLWGLYYFCFLMLEKIYLGKFLEKCPSILKRLYTMLVVLIGWVFFYFDDLSKIKYFFSVAFGGVNGFVSLTEKTILTNYAVLLVLGVIAAMPIVPHLKKFLDRNAHNKIITILVDVFSICFVIVALLVSTAAIVGSSYNPFLYFRF